jgi:anti-sigma factor RsiW
MSTEPTVGELHAFVDGELELSRHLQIESGLRENAALRSQVEAAQRLRDTVRRHADYHPAPAALRAALAANLAAAADAVRPAPTRDRKAGRNAVDALRQWLAWRPLASALLLAMVGVVTVNLVLAQRWQDERLREEVVASHARATMTGHLVDVASSDHHTVKPFLSARLDFSPPVRLLTVPGSTFLGGRVDFLDGRPVAALVYRQGQHIVDAYVWPTEDADHAVRISSLRGFRIARWTRQGMAHCVISDVSPEPFAAIARELELAPESAGSD